MSASERIQAELTRRILISEKMRALILSCAISICLPVLLAFLILDVVNSGAVRSHMIGFGICLIATVYEWWSYRNLSAAVRDDRPPRRDYYFYNATVELFIPILIIFLGANNTHPTHSINGPFSYVFFLLIILAPLRLDFSLCIYTGCVAAAAFGLVVIIHRHILFMVWGGSPLSMIFNYGTRVLLFALAGVVAAFVTRRIRAMLFETINHWGERERIIGLFGQHVSPAVVNQLLSQRSDISELRSVCVLVFDIRNFTTFSEHRQAEEVVTYLNTLWASCVGTVNRHEGIVNKFIGDGFLAIFGAPIALGNNAKQALAAAHEILNEIDRLVAEQKLPPTEVGMALHAGEVIVGTVGSSEKKEYTVIGDVVNVAFRIEALNKTFKSKLLISESVAKAAEVQGLESLPPILVKGRDEPVALFRAV
jgi:adenylate cyclase